jgi:hypothetical protein
VEVDRLYKTSKHTVKRLRLEKRKQAFYNTRGAKTLKPLKKGDVVYVKPKKNTKEWINAKVGEKMHWSQIVCCGDASRKNT